MNWPAGRAEKAWTSNRPPCLQEFCQEAPSSLSRYCLGDQWSWNSLPNSHVGRKERWGAAALETFTARTQTYHFTTRTQRWVSYLLPICNNGTYLSKRGYGLMGQAREVFRTVHAHSKCLINIHHIMVIFVMAKARRETRCTDCLWSFNDQSLKILCKSTKDNNAETVRMKEPA